MLKLIIGEAALEIITDTMINNLNKNGNFINKNFYNKILDKNIHYDIIKKLDNPDKRGRPDIVHFSLLESIDSPLYKNNDLEIYVHTVNDYVIKIGKELRLPRSYLRFNGLIEKLFKTRKILSNKKSLMTLNKIDLKSLIEQFNNCYIIGLSRLGRQSSYQDIALKLADGSIPNDPVSIAASSDKISPNKLSVTITSNCLGLRTSCIAQLSAYMFSN